MTVPTALPTLDGSPEAIRPRWGAHRAGKDQWRFAIWGPDVTQACVILDHTPFPAHREQDNAGSGWWLVECAAKSGAEYVWRLDGKTYPDPAARIQVGDVHGPSRLFDPAELPRAAASWRGRPWAEAVIYEMHLGTFTQGGTLRDAIGELPRLADLGITMVELMPLAQFDGARGWGYDGVLPWCLHSAYGSPGDLRAFTDAAHRLGISVILDVVHNHLGPSGNYLAAWCPSFFTPDRRSTWGEGIAWHHQAVRDFFIDSALAWLGDYQLDGLRLDAVHAIRDDTDPPFLQELGQRIRAFDWGREIHLITEDERNQTCHFTAGAPFDATWNDDWHHAVHCLLTGEAESYYAPFARDPIGDIATALRDGYVEQGQPRPVGEAEADSAPPLGAPALPRGEPSAHLPRHAFINFWGNHDQVGNRAKGERLHQLVTDDDALRTIEAMSMLAPFVPMIFMGDEFLTDAPFLFFCDFTGDLAEQVRRGRTAEFAGFSGFGGTVPDPIAHATFLASRIGTPQRQTQIAHQDFVRHVLALRMRYVVPMLRANPHPTCKVQRDGTTIEALWDFRPGRMALRARLPRKHPASADGHIEDDAFIPHDNARLLLRSANSRFALSFTASSPRETE